MAGASFTADQRFELLVINAAGGILPRTIYGVYIINGVRTYLNIDFRGATLPSGAQLDELEVLQSIYGSSAGLLNAAGDPTPIRIEDTIAGVIESVDDLERYGAFNPLQAGSIQRYQAKLRRVDGSVVSGGVPAIRHASWGGGNLIDDIVEFSANPVALGYGPGADRDYVRLSNVGYVSGQIRIENSLVEPDDCLLQAVVSVTDQSQWGWFMGIATEFRGFSQYPWSAYTKGIAVRFDWNGDVILLHTGQFDGQESIAVGSAAYVIPRSAGSWEVMTAAGGVRAISSGHSTLASQSGRYRNGAFHLEASRRVTDQKYGVSLESFGRYLDVIHDGDHIARWTWTDAFLPFRITRPPGTSYIIRGNGGAAWTRNGILRTPNTRIYAYNLSAGRNSAAAPGFFV